MSTDTQPSATPETPPRLLYSISEVKVMLGGLSTASIYRRIADNTLPTCRVGGRRFVRVDDLQHFVESLTE